MIRKILAWSLPLALTAAVALARPADGSKDMKQLQKQSSRLDDEAREPQGHDAIFESLSKQFNVPVATLQAEQKSTGFGFGELSIAHSLAAATGKSFDQLAQEFKSGKGWGVIARENNVKLGRVVSDLKRANKRAERERMERGQSGHGSGASAGANSRAGGRSHGAMGSRGRSHR